MHQTRLCFAVASLLLIHAPLRAGDFDQALSALARTFPEVRNVGVFYDQYGTLMNQLEFETSAYQQFGLSIKLCPLDPKQRITSESVRSICNRNGIQAILLMEGDPLIRPASPAGRALLSQASRMPVVGIHEAWIKAGAWFVVGPTTGGLRTNPSRLNAKVQEQLKALEAEMRPSSTKAQ